MKYQESSSILLKIQSRIWWRTISISVRPRHKTLKEQAEDEMALLSKGYCDIETGWHKAKTLSSLKMHYTTKRRKNGRLICKPTYIVIDAFGGEQDG